MSKKTKKAAKAASKVVGTLAAADGAVVEAAKPVADSPVVRVISFLSEIGDQPPMRALCAATLAFGLATRSPRAVRAGLRMLAAHTLATGVKDFVKLRVDRTRPREDDDHKPRPGRHTHKEITSFPSGHTAGAVAAAMAYAREFPEHRTIALTAAGAVALAQIPRCAHYPTDISAGAAIGLGAEAIVDAVGRGTEDVLTDRAGRSAIEYGP